MSACIGLHPRSIRFVYPDFIASRSPFVSNANELPSRCRLLCTSVYEARLQACTAARWFVQAVHVLGILNECRTAREQPHILTSSHPHILTSAGDRHDDIPRSLLNRRSLSIENGATNLTMPVGIGGVGDIIAITGLVNQFASALDGSRGSAAEYQEVRRELEGLEQALLCHHQLLQARCNDPGLDAIFTSSQKTAEDCKKCIEAFSQQTVKFDRSLGVGGGGNVCRDVTMKVRWQMSKKAEVVRFRAELAQHIASLNMLFALANM